MSDTAIDICNRALLRCGAERITSFDDETAEAIACRSEYDAAVAEALTVPGGRPYRWRFASSQENLVQLVATPKDRWAYAYQVPPDTLMVHGVTRNDQLVRYDRYNDLIYSDDTGPLVVDRTFRPDPSMFPAYFASGLVRDLTTRLAVGLARDIDLARVCGDLFSWQAARSADSAQQTARRLTPRRYTNSRFY